MHILSALSPELEGEDDEAEGHRDAVDQEGGQQLVQGPGLVHGQVVVALIEKGEKQIIVTMQYTMQGCNFNLGGDNSQLVNLRQIEERAENFASPQLMCARVYLYPV